MTRTKPRPRVLAGLALLTLAAAVQADDLYRGLNEPHLDWSVYAGAARTDNATLQIGGPSDTIESAGVKLALFRESGGLTALLSGDVRQEHYADHTFKDATVGSGHADISYAFIPERFTWVLTDAAGQINQNPYLPSTPQNRVNANIASTGPEALLRVGSSTSFAIGARVDESTFSDQSVLGLDNRRVSAHLGLIERTSAASSWSLNAGAARVEYRIAGAPDYDQADLYGSYLARTTRGGVSFDFGATEVRESGTTRKEPLLRATLFHRLTPSWNVNISAGSELINAGQAFFAAVSGVRVINGQPVPQGGAGGYTDVLLAQNIDRSDFARVSFDFARPRTQLGFTAGYQRDRFPFGSDALSRKLVDAGVRLTRRMRHNLDARADFSYDRRTPDVSGPGDHTTYANVGLSWRVGGMLSIDLIGHREVRTADVGGIAYTERFVYLGLSYGPPKHAFAPKPLLRPGAPGQPGQPGQPSQPTPPAR